MAETLPADIKKDLAEAISLHQRASADHQKCLEFNKLMADLLGRLEDAGCDRTADRVMGILLDCQPKDGAHCDKSSLVAEKMKKFEALVS